ncbi:MAG: sigma-70 family RNA polymerase sigma factor [Labilithrix sp.]|nr:sigma-70 family RNA polymerase sigma factor [Labilithrix sp.]
MRPLSPFTVRAPTEERRRRATATGGRALEEAPAFVPVELAPASPEPPSESVRLARAAASGDARAMRDLLRQLGPRIERVVRAVLGRADHDAEDVVQQAMLGFVQALPSFRGECEPVHFASRVAARTAIAAARRRRVARARHDDGVVVDLLTSETPEPLADTERRRRASVLRDALARIPQEQAETLALRVVLGWSLSEVAEATGAPLNTVRSRLRLAKTALRAAIDRDAAATEELGGTRDA